ncbi:hypothetical protein BFG52_06470 [Acinetobacter larvae]|uniref:Metalloprotease n=2 Tax=Acinetobacter larvae TaxID=1789224 RepID=A0A1B2M409_9GAMM|nr:hypothetical protein BFG52_06470 [Acinetobacter larvae]
MREYASKFFLYTWLLMVIFQPSIVSAENLETFDVHFSVLSNNPNAKAKATLSQLKEEVNILNQYFIADDGRSIVKFRFKSVTFYDDLKNSSCKIVDLGDARRAFSLDSATVLFNHCQDRKVKDKNAINIYIFDEYNERKGFASANSYGKRNLNRPFIFLDWHRLNHNVQSPEEHEMGHAFGLNHICEPTATIKTSTNIMTSACKGGSGGKRNIGFNTAQVRTIMHYVPLIKAQLAQR